MTRLFSGFIIKVSYKDTKYGGDEMNKALLRAEMIKHGDTQETLANAMGISLSRLNAKINSDNAEFRQTEIIFIKDRYNLSAADVDSIFFNV